MVFTIVVRLLKFSRDNFRLSILVYVPTHIVKAKNFKKLIFCRAAVLKILKFSKKMPFMRRQFCDVSEITGTEGYWVYVKI